MENDKKVATNNNNLEVEDTINEKSYINYMGIKAMPFIIGNETFEKLGALGALANLLVYLTTIFNMNSITATTIINVFNGTTNFGALVGAILSDTYFGRYKTLAFSSVATFMGLLMIALTAAIKQLHPPHCATKEAVCVKPTTWQLVVLYSGFGLMVLGAGGIRPCNLAFGADQFDPNTESGKKGIKSFFNWYVFTYTFAEMVALTMIVYVQTEVSWAVGLAIPASLMLIACVLYFMGSKLYVRVKPHGSPLTSMVQVLVVAVKKRKLRLQEQDKQCFSLFDYVSPGSFNTKLSYTDQFRCLNRAAIITNDDKINQDGSAKDPWNLCSIQQVEEVKSLLRILPIWASAIIFNVAIIQQHTYVIFQALQSDRHLFGKNSFEIPAASYVIFIMLGLTFCLVIHDRILVPLLERFTGKQGGITILQRMGIGMILSILTMIISALVEERRRTTAQTKPTLGYVPRKGAISSMSGFWLIPQLTLAGAAEAFTAVGQLELYYKQFPENMRTIAGSVLLCGFAISSYLSSFLVSLIHRTTEKHVIGSWLSEDLNKGRLDYFYYLIAGLGTLNFVVFLAVSKWYKYKDSGQNKIQVGDESHSSSEQTKIITAV